jgi:hypothetical protein
MQYNAIETDSQSMDIDPSIHHHDDDDDALQQASTHDVLLVQQEQRVEPLVGSVQWWTVALQWEDSASEEHFPHLV